MARDYIIEDFSTQLVVRRHNVTALCIGVCIAATLLLASPLANNFTPGAIAFFSALLPCVFLIVAASATAEHRYIERERLSESERRGGSPVLGMPPNRMAFDTVLEQMGKEGKSMIDRYLVGFELDSGEPIWVTDDEICSHAAVFAKTGVGKTLWLEGLMFQQMARGRASGFTFIDAKRDPGTLADIIMMALLTGRIEDVVVVDPFDPVCAYNFVFTTQRADVKARKVLRCGLPPTSDQSTTKHYDRLAADAVYRVVRAMESLGLAWSVRDIAVALSAFTVAYPRMRELLHEQGNKQAMVELGHLAGSYRTAKGSLDAARLTDNLRGIASELHSIANSEAGEMFCVPRADLSLTDAILRGKIIYYMLPRLEEAESAARMVKVFREDLEVSIGEVTSSRTHHLEDPHMVIIDEGASTFGPTWANLFELARKGRFSLLFGAQSIGGLMDASMGLSKEFYERVIANVNLKVIMRIGDNRTAEDMCEWIGLIKTQKTTIATGTSSSLNSRELTKHLELNRRSADGIRDGFTFSEDETELVSAEELKHEMSAEKGLAWFDKGDGRLRKGRSIWFDADLPSTWEGREFLVRYESVEADEIGLAEWVDETILSVERAEHLRGVSQSQSVENQQSAAGQSSGNKDTNGGADKSSETNSSGDDGASTGGAFRINPLKGFRGMGRARVTVAAPPPAQDNETTSPAKPSQNEAKESANKDQTPTQSSTESKKAPTEDAGSSEKKSTKESARSEDTQSNDQAPTKTSSKPGLQFAEDRQQTPASNTDDGDKNRSPKSSESNEPNSKETISNAQSSKAQRNPQTPETRSKQNPSADSAKPSSNLKSCAADTTESEKSDANGNKSKETVDNTSKTAANSESSASDTPKKKKRRRRRSKKKKAEGESKDTKSPEKQDQKAESSDRLALRGTGRDTITQVPPSKIVH